MSDELATWLKAQLDEDEAYARNTDGDAVVEWVGDQTEENGEPEAGTHIGRWLPSRVLAEVEAKRRILDAVVDEANSLDYMVDHDRRIGDRDSVTEPYLGDVLLRLLALPYADREGYREEWRVS